MRGHSSRRERNAQTSVLPVLLALWCAAFYLVVCGVWCAVPMVYDVHVHNCLMSVCVLTAWVQSIWPVPIAHTRTENVGGAAAVAFFLWVLTAGGVHTTAV
jgi:hypothetical protein